MSNDHDRVLRLSAMRNGNKSHLEFLALQGESKLALAVEQYLIQMFFATICFYETTEVVNNHAASLKAEAAIFDKFLSSEAIQNLDGLTKAEMEVAVRSARRTLGIK